MMIDHQLEAIKSSIIHDESSTTNHQSAWNINHQPPVIANHHSWTIDPESQSVKRHLTIIDHQSSSIISPELSIIIRQPSIIIHHHICISQGSSSTIFMEPSHIDGPWLDDPSRLWPHISMQNPASAESNLWKQIRKIQWWTNRWKTSEMPPNVVDIVFV